MKRILYLIVCICVAFVSNAKTYSGKCGENVTWSLDQATGVLKISGTGAMYDYNDIDDRPWESYEWYVKSVTIGDGITHIGKYSLFGLDMKELSIPNSVISIGRYACEYCYYLENLYIPSSITSIEYGAFGSIGEISGNLEVNISDLNAWLKIDFKNEDANPASFAKSFKLNGGEITNLTIPAGVETIKPYTFYNCANIINIDVPESLVCVGEHAFEGTGWYNNQEDGVVYIGKNLFNHKGETVTTKSIDIKEGTVSISNYAFFRCSGLESISCPSSLRYIGVGAFRGHSTLRNIKLNEGLEVIDNDAFWNSKLEEIEIPSTVKKIGEIAFNGTNLAKFKIPASVVSIGEKAFYGLKNLSSIVVDENNPNYDSRNNCNALIETATNTLLQGCNNTIIPNTINHIGLGAFNWCTSFTNIEIPNSVKSIGVQAFYNCTNLEKITLPESVIELGHGVFYNCESLRELEMPNSVLIAGNTLFQNCTSLKRVKFSNNIRKIGAWTFFYCTSLESVEFPTELDSIGTYAFSSCTSLKNIVIPNTVKVIEEYAFNWCKGLKEVTIGSGVEEMGQCVFRECDSLTVINSYIENPQPININTFKDYDNAVLYVPVGSKSKYQATDYWSQFSNIIEKFNVSGIETIGVKNDMPIEYYDLQGVKVKTPKNGIYIKKQGSRTTKVLL